MFFFSPRLQFLLLAGVETVKASSGAMKVFAEFFFFLE